MGFRRLVSDLVDLGALGAGAYRLRIEPVRLRPLLEQCAETQAAAAAAKALALEVRLEPGVPPLVHADEARLVQILCLLLDNAVRVTEKGSVRLVALLAPPDSLEGHEPGRLAGDWLELRVEDTGPGIGESDRERLLHLFHALRGGERGKGLSIALAARWCQAMGACLRVESDGACGSSFVICLPLGQPSSPEPVVSPDLSPPMPA